MNGIINFLKPTGMSSSQAVGFIKKTLHISKVGHAGTLDPLATGVLPIMLGRATKLFDYMQHHQKEYICEVYFGKTTTTLDAEGEVVATTNIIPTDEAIDNALPLFLGNIQQQPPMYSALKVNGQRLYAKARHNEVVEVPERATTVYEIKRLNSIQNGKVRLYIKCQSGFYVRSLCRDLGLALHTVAFMNALVRVSVADFSLNQALTIEAIKNATDVQTLITPPEVAVHHLPSISLSHSDYKPLRNGVPSSTHLAEGRYLVFCNAVFKAIAKVEHSQLKLETIIHLEETE